MKVSSTLECLLCRKKLIPTNIPTRTKYAASENFKNNINKKSKSVSEGREVLFGIHPIQLALTAKRRKLYKLYIKETASNLQGDQSYISVSMAAEGIVEKQWVTRYFLDKLSGLRPHQGVCLEAGPLVIPDMDISKAISLSVSNTKEKFPVWLLPYRVKDPMNLGAILRSSYFLGVDRVVLPVVHTCPLNPVVSKASAGAMEVINISQVKNDGDVTTVVQKWKDFGGQVVGACLSDADNTVQVQDFSVQHPTLLIVGNEEKGIKDTISSMCDTYIGIYPASNVHKQVDSLNVSVATGILLHHLTKNNKTFK